MLQGYFLHNHILALDFVYIFSWHLIFYTTFFIYALGYLWKVSSPIILI